MRLFILSSMLLTSCVIPHTAEDRCINAGLNIKTFDIVESSSGRQQVTVHCEEMKK